MYKSRNEDTLMIYQSKGYTTHHMIAMKSEEKDDFETLVNMKVTLFNEMASLESIKRHKAPYFLAGELLDGVRNDHNLKNKNVLAIDYDDLDMTEEKFKAHLLSTIGASTFYAYPSIRHGLKGTRYRLIVKIDRPFVEDEHIPLVKFITGIIGLPYDKASEKWSQPVGLPVTFKSEQDYQGKCILNRGRAVLDVDIAIKTMKEREQQSKQQSRSPHRRKRTDISEILEQLIEPIEEGSRNVQLTKRIGKLFYLEVDATSIYQWAHLINDNIVTPSLEAKEVNAIFKSILKAEKQKMKKGVF